MGKLAVQMRAAGYQPEQVDDIVITHMHPDHVGGAPEGQAVFPNATVHADKADADADAGQGHVWEPLNYSSMVK